MTTLAEEIPAIPSRPLQAGTYWRSISIFNLYRIAIALIFIGSYYLLSGRGWLDNYDSELYLHYSVAYLLFGIAAAGLTKLRWPQFNQQVTLQVMLDIGFIVILMYAAGGIKSGLGLLLVIAIAAASLISNGRLALFYAAVATISLLLEQTYQLISWNEHYDDYSHAVMLCVSCFATAWLAHSFARRTYLSETLASQREVDLENLEQINALITQEMPDGVLVVDSELQVRHQNTQAQELLAMAAAGWQGQQLDDSAPQLATLLRNWMNDDTAESASAKLASSERELKLRFMPVGADRRHGAVIFIEDWSQMQAQAQQMKLVALGQLTANIAHEIRNPLSAISHATQLMQEVAAEEAATEISADAATPRLLQIIADNVQRMDQMVKDILELNRRDRTRQEVFSSNAFIAEFHEQFCQIEKIPADAFVLVPQSVSADILFDRRHLHQILWNLCRNGWRHSLQQAGSLTLGISTTARARNVSIEVRDDGPGIPRDAQSHIFEPFFTTESTGTGLGLYIARELCEANSATLKYSAQQPGSLFSLGLRKHHNKQPTSESKPAPAMT